MAQENLALGLLRRAAEAGGSAGFIDTPGGRLRTLVRGPRAGPPLLLLHGLGDSIPGWAQALLPLCLRFRVHLIDLPGHGLSGTPPDWRFPTLLAAVRAWADSLCLSRPPLLVGHSLGGWLATRLVLSGFAASGLALVNPAGALLPEEDWAPFRALVSARDAAGARSYLEHAFHRPPLALRLFPGEVVKAMAAPATRGFLSALAGPDFLRPDELASLRLPLRLVWGAHDRLLPAGTRAFFRDHLPRVEVVELAGAGHCPHLEAPFRLAAALLAPMPAAQTVESPPPRRSSG